MNKPEPQTLTYYDWTECSKYLQDKYGPDYENLFWHWVIDKAGDIRNGSYFVMCEWWGEDAEEWQRTILNYYLDEFGEGEKGDRSIDFNVWW